MLKSAEGERMFRKVTVRVIFPENIMQPKVVTQHAPAHMGFTANAIDTLLMNVADKLEELHPYWEFKPIELKPEGRTARYVFTFAGYRPIPQIPDTSKSADAVASGPEAAINGEGEHATSPHMVPPITPLPREQAS